MTSNLDFNDRIFKRKKKKKKHQDESFELNRFELERCDKTKQPSSRIVLVYELFTVFLLNKKSSDLKCFHFHDTCKALIHILIEHIVMSSIFSLQQKKTLT